MYHGIKQCEYSSIPFLASTSFGHIATLAADIYTLQHWACCSIATVRKTRYVIGFLEWSIKDNDNDKEVSSLFIEDYSRFFSASMPTIRVWRPWSL